MSDAAVGRSRRSIRDYRQCVNLVRERILLVDPVPARVSMASPAPMKSIPFPLLRKSNRYLACGTPFLRYAEFSRHTLGASVYGAFEEAQIASTWHFSPERHEVRRLYPQRVGRRCRAVMWHRQYIPEHLEQ